VVFNNFYAVSVGKGMHKGVMNCEDGILKILVGFQVGYV
jgi:hypothetical protein